MPLAHLKSSTLKPCDQLTDLFDLPLVSLFECLPLSNIEKFFKQLIFFSATFLWVVAGWGLCSLARHKFQQCRESDRQHHPRLAQKIQNYSSYSHRLWLRLSFLLHENSSGLLDTNATLTPTVEVDSQDSRIFGICRSLFVCIWKRILWWLGGVSYDDLEWYFMMFWGVLFDAFRGILWCFEWYFLMLLGVFFDDFEGYFLRLLGVCFDDFEGYFLIIWGLFYDDFEGYFMKDLVVYGGRVSSLKRGSQLLLETAPKS